MSIAENVAAIRDRIAAAALAAGRRPDEILLVAASKMNSADRVAEAIRAGVPACGENRVQELVEKNAQGAYHGAQLHFIGSLQKNKINKLVGVCDLIQSVDSLELLALIDRRAAALGIRQAVLLEVNIGGEAAKSGLAPEALPAFLEKASALSALDIRGLMAIPPISHVPGGNRAYFARMRQLFVDNSVKKYDNVSMDFLSMGMSGDFEEAIAEGSNMVRVGSALFGVRTYPQSVSEA